ncbi:hypothetical protein [Chondrinema litorale]|uniref:hypothetical protein n=1 Tax=Chondrinema litorale TaxID=2994555 RepID=UPI0025436B45|nr:hypothetical protein [Chondrinema litorale]UZR92923.1 hypothetical protein OQ292_13760 [Chondrinema litorale]
MLIKNIYFWLLILCLFILRVVGLQHAGLFDYDSVTNYQIIQKLSVGNFSRLYHHASPLFYLFFLPFYKLGASLLNNHFLILEYVNALINLSAISIFTIFFGEKVKLNTKTQLLFLAFSGTGFLLFSTSKYFSIESLSLLSFNISVIYFYKYFKEENANKSWNLAWFWSSVTACINYKQIYFIAFFAFLYLISERKHLRINSIFTAALFLALPPLLMLLTGMFMGLDWLTYPKYYWVQTFVKDMNPYAEVPPFRADFWFYPLYLLFLEPAVIIMLLIGLFFLFKKKALKLKKSSPVFFLLLLAIPYLLFVSFLQKAPRGLLPVYLPTSLIIFTFVINHLKWKTALTSILVALNCFFIFKEFSPFQKSNYEEVVKFIEEKHINKLAVTSGKGIMPFLNKDSIEIAIVFHENELKQLEPKGFQYCLVDFYFLASHPNNFNSIINKKALFATNEPKLLNQMLFLEHSEFTGNTFCKTLENYQALRNLKNHLFIIKL